MSAVAAESKLFHVEHPVERMADQRRCAHCGGDCETKGRYCRACRREYMRRWRVLVKGRTPKRRTYRRPGRVWRPDDRATSMSGRT